MKIIDISWPITQDMTTYKNRDDISLSEHAMRCNYHLGTHVDAPAHFIAGGKTIDQIDVSKFHGAARIFDMTHVSEKITQSDLESYTIQPDEIIVLKTKNSDLSANESFDFNFVYLDASGAQYLAEQNIKAFGFDYLGIERSQPNHDSHRALLEKEIVIIEGLRLAHVQPGSYQFCCLPLFVHGADGAPARAILRIL